MEVSFPLDNKERMKNALFALAETMVKALENLPSNEEKNIFITASTNEARHILEKKFKELGFKVTYNETKNNQLSQDEENEVKIGINDLKPSTPKQT